MVTNRLAFLVVGVACVGAAGAGSYIATRQNTVAPVEAAAAPPASQALVASAVSADQNSAAMSAAPAAAVPPVAAVGTAAAAAPAPKTAAITPQATSSKRPQTVEHPVKSEAPIAPAASTESAADRTWPAAPAPGSQNPGIPAEPPAATAAVDEKEAPQPPVHRFADLEIAADSVIGLRTETRLSSERSRVEDRVEAKVVRDVRVGGEIAVPAGTRAVGTVVVVDRGGKFKERARIGIRFDELQLPNGTRVPLSTDTIYRYGEAPGNSSAAKIGGGAVAGAILGAIIGGGKGAAIGAASGAGAGTGVAATGDRSEATFAAGSDVTARILTPLTVTVERE